MDFCIENSFEDDVWLAQRNKQLYECMEFLPSAQKEALYLVYVEEMSYKDAAAVLKRTVKQVDKLLQLGKKELKPLLRNAGLEPDVI